jgi:hypothetical protein
LEKSEEETAQQFRSQRLFDEQGCRFIEKKSTIRSFSKILRPMVVWFTAKPGTLEELLLALGARRSNSRQQVIIWTSKIGHRQPFVTVHRFSRAGGPCYKLKQSQSETALTTFAVKAVSDERSQINKFRRTD